MSTGTSLEGVEGTLGKSQKENSGKRCLCCHSVESLFSLLCSVGRARARTGFCSSHFSGGFFPSANHKPPCVIANLHHGNEKQCYKWGIRAPIRNDPKCDLSNAGSLWGAL